VSRRPTLPPGPWLVVGLARSGVAAIRLLADRGERVIGSDAGELRGDALTLDGVELHGGTDGLALLEHVRAVVKSPGVGSDAPVIVAARARGLPVLGELELAWRCVERATIAVTGTNGKTTTVELIGHLHREAGLPVAVVGNVGTPYSSLATARVPPAPDATVVCEASSFQLEDTLAFAPEAAVLLNLGVDHIDRHGTIAAYHAAKLRVFAHQANEDVAVAPVGLGVEDLGGCARRVCFGEAPQAELSLRAGTLWWDDQVLMRAGEVRLRGAHNLRNAMAGAAVCLARGMDPGAVRAGLRTFAGVPHRLEEVAEREGVLYVNDSKATNVESTLVALAAFAESPVHLILGGEGKNQDFTPLRSAIAGATVASVHLIGRDAALLAAALGGNERPPVSDDGDLEHAVARAAAAARPGDVVLLSPACASFDQFTDFEARGRAFAALAIGEQP
jgi:UDP-N-acetylmuramoylalanine--D-glutamate ligase